MGVPWRGLVACSPRKIMCSEIESEGIFHNIFRHKQNSINLLLVGDLHMVPIANLYIGVGRYCVGMMSFSTLHKARRPILKHFGHHTCTMSHYDSDILDPAVSQTLSLSTINVHTCLCVACT